MAQLNLQINGYNYLVGCEDGQEEHLSAMAQMIQRRVDSVKAIGQHGEARLLLLSALLLADELHDKEAALAEAHAAIRSAPTAVATPAPTPTPAVPVQPEAETIYVNVIDPEFDATVQRLAKKAEEIAEALERA